MCWAIPEVDERNKYSHTTLTLLQNVQFERCHNIVSNGHHISVLYPKLYELVIGIYLYLNTY